MPRDLRHAGLGRGGGGEPHEIERAGAQPGLARGIRADGQVCDEHAVHTGREGAVEHRMASREDGIQVRKQHDRYAELRPGDEFERGVEGDALGECLL